MTLPLDSAWGAGWNVPDGSLVLFSTDLSPYTVPRMGITITPRAPLIDMFPIRSLTLDGSERGDGQVNLNWGVAGVYYAAEGYIEDTYLSGGTIVSAKMTIVTWQRNHNVLKKFNCWLNLPKPGQDYSYDSNFVLDLQLRFTDLIAI